jgi:uncharacterized protein YjbI with pentapeptide repeats
MSDDPFAGRDLFSQEIFSGLTLGGPEPRNCRFEECRFVDCRITGNAFRVGSFLHCSFEGCDLSNWLVEGLRFVEVRFKASKLVGFQWATVKPDPLTMVRFEDCALDYSDFSRFRLKDGFLKGCSVREANFERTDLSGADCRDSDFSGSTFSDTNLQKADLRGARGYGIDARRNRLKGARFSLPDALGLLEALEVKVE